MLTGCAARLAVVRYAFRLLRLLCHFRRLQTSQPFSSSGTVYCPKAEENPDLQILIQISDRVHWYTGKRVQIWSHTAPA
jgi:hypothetical protein